MSVHFSWISHENAIFQCTPIDIQTQNLFLFMKFYIDTASGLWYDLNDDTVSVLLQGGMYHVQRLTGADNSPQRRNYCRLRGAE